MQAIKCPNCGYLTVYKRHVGFLTVMAVILTFGVWALLIPFYSKRCVNCGYSYSKAASQSRKNAKNYHKYMQQQAQALKIPNPSIPSPYNPTSATPRKNPSLRKQKRTTTSSPDSFWIHKDKPVTIAGHSISCGMLYVGEGLKGARGYGTESALINPKLRINNANPDWGGENVGYWPSYSELDPSSRAAYLRWLGNGFIQDDAYIGYVFLYFYGLERRALVDTKESEAARRELPLIIDEVKRLLSLYGNKSSSFRNYANAFLDALCSTSVQDKVYLAEPPLYEQSYDFPLKLKLALAQTATDNVPIPAAWALIWVRSKPYTSLRTPAERCQKELAELFKIKYEERFGDGIVLKPGKKRLTVSYRAANGSMGGNFDFTLSQWPDVVNNTQHLNKLSALVESCIDDLSAYSRFIGRSNNDKDSLEAQALLPSSLIEQFGNEKNQAVMDWAKRQLENEEYAVISFDQLLKRVSISQEDLNKKKMISIAQYLSKIGIGLEPDVRFGSPYAKAKKAVLFKLPENSPHSPSPEYSTAELILHLAASVSGADGNVGTEEEQHLESQLELWLHLSDEERDRLRAHTKWLISDPPNLNGIKKKLEAIGKNQREGIALLMIDIAQADGFIDAQEMKTLEKIYKLLSLNAQELYSHAHSAASTTTAEPVTVQRPSSNETKYSISEPYLKKEPVKLNSDLIQTKLAETAAVTALLSNIFILEDDQGLQTEQIQDSSVPGLDAEQIAFAKILLQKTEWSRDDLERLASKSNLMLDGALESINEASFDLIDQSFFDGDDPIEINQSAVNEFFQ